MPRPAHYHTSESRKLDIKLLKKLFRQKNPKTNQPLYSDRELALQLSCHVSAIAMARQQYGLLRRPGHISIDYELVDKLLKNGLSPTEASIKTGYSVPAMSQRRRKLGLTPMINKGPLNIRSGAIFDGEEVDDAVAQLPTHAINYAQRFDEEMRLLWQRRFANRFLTFVAFKSWLGTREGQLFMERQNQLEILCSLPDGCSKSSYTPYYHI